MPAISPVSEADRPQESELLPLKIARVRKSAPSAIWPEALRRLARSGFAPLLHGLRRSWFYRQTLRGYLPDRFELHPQDPRARRLEDADAIMRGRFHFAGQAVELDQGSVFDAVMPSAQFAACLHGFEWLRHLEAAGGDLSRDIALGLTQNWLKRNAHYALPAWDPAVTAERLFNFFAHGRFFLANSDLVWRSKLFVSLRDQMVVLSRSLEEAEDGLPRLKTAAVLALSGISLGDEKCTARGLKYLDQEIGRQILPDGGHVGRSPETLLEIYRLLSVVQQALEGRQWNEDVALAATLDRIVPMLSFLRMGDGALPNFNGGNEGEAAVMAAFLERGEDDTRPLGHAANSGFQRLASGRTLIMMDAGCAPPAAYSASAHTGCLGFEMSSGRDRVIVNCGAGPLRDSEWGTALRATAAHSTLTLDDTSQAMVLTGSMLAGLLGPRLSGGPTLVETRRAQGAHGLSVEATHDGYVSQFGLLHQRRLILSRRGAALAGADRLIPVESRAWTKAANGRASREGIPFAVRFHIHPDVRLSLAQARGSVILKLPSGEGWRFRCGGGTLSIEESVYFGGGFPRRAEQLVVSGLVRDKQAEMAWVFEEFDAA